MGGGHLSTLATIALLLVTSALFSAAEIGFLALGRHRARRMSEGRLAVLVEKLVARPTVTLGALLVAITVINYSAEALAASWVITELRLPVWVAIVGMAVVVMVFAEAVPISYAVANPGRVARAMALPLWVAVQVLSVPARAIGFLADRLARLAGGHPVPKAPVTEGEIRAIVDLQAEAGGLEEEEKVMIHQIFEFGDKVVREVMVPRPDMVAVPEMAAAREVAKAASEHRISRMPVHGRDFDDVVGIVYVKDLLPLLAAGRREEPAKNVMRSVLRVPETKKLSDLMTDFRRQRRSVAIVVDEYGGTAGLVTLEDLLEEVVGDIYDEYDLVRPQIEKLGPDVLRMDGGVSVGDASELLGVMLPEGDYDSVGGVLYSRLGTVPKAGEEVELEGVTLIAEEVHEHRITRVKAILRQEPEAESGDQGEV